MKKCQGGGECPTALHEGALKRSSASSASHSSDKSSFRRVFTRTDCGMSLSLIPYVVFSVRLMLLKRAVAKGGSVCPSVCHAREPRLRGSRYRNTFGKYRMIERCF